MEGIQNNQTESKRHGGARRGAGRESTALKILRDPRYLAARGANPLSAAMILERIIDERRVWERIFKSTDDRVVLQALMFLTSMRDGKPSQQINVTSTQITLNASDIERARDIVREIRGETVEPRLGSGEESPLTVDASVAQVDEQGEERAKAVDSKGVATTGIMLLGGEGGEKGG